MNKNFRSEVNVDLFIMQEAGKRGGSPEQMLFSSELSVILHKGKGEGRPKQAHCTSGKQTVW